MGRTLVEWSDEDLRQIHALRTGEERIPWADIGKRFGTTGNAARCAYKRYSSLDDNEEEEQDPADDDGLVIHDDDEDEEYDDEPILTIMEEWHSKQDKPSWKELCQYAQRGADLQSRMRPVSVRGERIIHTSEPFIYVAHISDLHLGAPTTDYQMFLTTSDFIKSHPNIFLIINGPDLENALRYFRDASAVLNQVMPPWMQLEAFALWLEEMLPRTICMCGDNHVYERLMRYLGDIGLAIPQGVPFFQAFGILTLKIDNGKGDPVKYKAALVHRYKGHSIYHKMQPVIRVFRDIDPTADWYCTAHTHTPGYLEGCWYPEMRREHPRQHMLVCGTFKTGPDLYSMQNFGASGVLGIPTLRLGTGEYRIDYFKDPEAPFL